MGRGPRMLHGGSFFFFFWSISLPSQVISFSYVILPKRGVPQISQIAKVLAYQDFTEHFSGICVILWVHLI